MFFFITCHLSVAFCITKKKCLQIFNLSISKKIFLSKELWKGIFNIEFFWTSFWFHLNKKIKGSKNVWYFILLCILNFYWTKLDKICYSERLIIFFLTFNVLNEMKHFFFEHFVHLWKKTSKQFVKFKNCIRSIKSVFYNLWTVNYTFFFCLSC